MSEIYYLNGDILPTIPIPHDCEICKITFENQFLIFTFTDNINLYDSIQYIKPEAKSLVIKYHLEDECFSLYEWHKPVKFFAKHGFYKAIDESELFKLPDTTKRLSYCFHCVSYQTMIIELFALDRESFRLEITPDYVEFCWK